MLGRFRSVALIAILAISTVAVSLAQNSPDAGRISPNRKWALGFWGGGGTGLGNGSGTYMFNASFRLGKLITAEHGPGFLRGKLEYAADFTPAYVFSQDHTILPLASPQLSSERQTVYGGGFTPFILKWNFNAGRKVHPFAAAEGGVIFTTSNVPAGDTSNVNFNSGFEVGIQVPRPHDRALTFSGFLSHISNAELGNRNPGINVSLQFRVGYQWWK
jgi:lipid A 3-O-deacylase